MYGHTDLCMIFFLISLSDVCASKAVPKLGKKYELIISILID
jgi:hypothetical protein